MTRAEAMAARVGAARALRLAQRLAARVAVPRARVTRDGTRVTIVGRGVRAALRWPGGLLR